MNDGGCNPEIYFWKAADCPSLPLKHNAAFLVEEINGVWTGQADLSCFALSFGGLVHFCL